MDIKSLYKLFLNSSGITTDTRSISKGNIFFALKGPNFNANKLALEALEKGASYAVIDDENFVSDKCILVDDCLETLQQMARHHRDQFNIPILGITGSNGKTTTKELVAAVLQTTFKIHFTQGNFNNHIGVPLTLLSMPLDTELGIIEMGANHIGEIEELCNIANPDYGLITNIGKAHIEGFGSLEGVAKTKSELFFHVLKHGKNIFYNSTDTHLSRMASRFEKPINFPEQGDFCTCEVSGNFPIISIAYNGLEIKSNLIGKYNFSNIAAAICIGQFFEVSQEQIKAGIEDYKPTNNRSQIIQKGSNTVLLDAYNANPSSMEAALNNFKELDAKRKVVILGDMFELGEIEQEEHEHIGELLSKYNFDATYLCGKLMKFATNKYPKAQYFDNIEALKIELSANPLEDAYVLVKGSRSMGLESLYS